MTSKLALLYFVEQDRAQRSFFCQLILMFMRLLVVILLVLFVDPVWITVMIRYGLKFRWLIWHFYVHMNLLGRRVGAWRAQYVD